MQKVMQAYFNTKATTTSPGDVIILLYDGAISFLEQAKQKIAEKDYAQKGILISKAIDVISELDNSLNIEKGGTLAENLHSLYFFCNTHLFQANLKMDIAKIDKVISILTSLKSAFEEVVNTPEAMQAAQANTIPQRAQAKQLRVPTASMSQQTSSIGSARASSLYAKNTRAFPPATTGLTPSAGDIQQPAEQTIPLTPATTVDKAPPLQQEIESNGLQALAPAGTTRQQAGGSSVPPKSPEKVHETAHPHNSAVEPPPPPSEESNPALSPPPKFESRFQGAALYKKFGHN